MADNQAEQNIAPRFFPYEERKWKYVNLKTGQVYIAMKTRVGLDFLWERVKHKYLSVKPSVPHVHIEDCGK